MVFCCLWLQVIARSVDFRSDFPSGSGTHEWFTPMQAHPGHKLQLDCYQGNGNLIEQTGHYLSVVLSYTPLDGEF